MMISVGRADWSIEPAQKTAYALEALKVSARFGNAGRFSFKLADLETSRAELH